MMARSAVTSVPPRAPRTRAVLEAFGITSNGLVVDPPHDDVVEDRAVGVVEEVGVLGPARPDLAEVVGQGRLQQVDAVGPVMRTVPRWLTSKATASFRQARCSAMVPSG